MRWSAPVLRSRHSVAPTISLQRSGRKSFPQTRPGLTDKAFCASNVAFHRTLVVGAGNTVFSYQLAGTVEASESVGSAGSLRARTLTPKSTSGITRATPRETHCCSIARITLWFWGSAATTGCFERPIVQNAEVESDSFAKSLIHFGKQLALAHRTSKSAQAK